jgi:hypothetical protein
MVRDLLWAMTLVAVASAWLWDHTRFKEILRRQLPGMTYEMLMNEEVGMTERDCKELRNRYLMLLMNRKGAQKTAPAGVRE